LKHILNELRNEIESNGSDENLNPKESKSLSKLLELIPKDGSADGGELKATVEQLNAKIDSIQEQLTTTPRPPPNESTTGENLFVLTNFDVLKKEIEILKDENSHKERLLADVTSQVKTKEVSLDELQAELKSKEDNWNLEKNRLDEKMKKMEVDLENSADEIAACGVHLEEFKNLREKLGGYFFKWRTVLYFFLKTGKRYRPNSFCIVIYEKFVLGSSFSHFRSHPVTS